MLRQKLYDLVIENVLGWDFVELRMLGTTSHTDPEDICIRQNLIFGKS